MQSKEIHYKDKEITIIWKPALCTHAGLCVKTLPNVYFPKDKPWVKTNIANTEELIAQIKQCPSGALSFVYNEEKK